MKDKRYTLLDFLVIPLKITPLWTVIRILNEVISGLIPAAQVIVLAQFVDTALAIFDGKAEIQEIYKCLLGVLLIIAYMNIQVTLMNIVTNRFNIKLRESFQVDLMAHRAKLHYQHIEENDTWDLIKRVCDDAVGKLTGGFSILLQALNMIVNIGSLFMMVVMQVWWAALVILLVTVPLMFVAARAGKADYEAFKEAAKYTRKADYLKNILTGREMVEERSVFGYTEKVNQKWHEAFEHARKINLKVQAMNFIRMKGASLITVFISLFIVAILLFPLDKGTLSIGMFMSLVTAAFNLIQMMSWQLSYVTREIANKEEYMKDLSLFSKLSLQEGALKEKDLKLNFNFKKIEFCNVSFRYPGTERYILKDFSLILEAQKRYAVVGLNGAGKTTLTKLLTKMYDQYEGEIFINDKNLKEYTLEEIKAIFSVVYQDFAKYQVSVADNVLLGAGMQCTEEEMSAALEHIELLDKVKELPKGLETDLGKIKEDGVDLSGGQWQRLAIARALVSNAAMVILDEPTAALDPIAESTVYDMFNEVTKGKSSLSITHRLGASKRADEIIVINEGKVAEKGNHEVLMRLKGIYATMFESQRSWYQ